MKMIPKIIHQIWIGSLPPPTECMNSWSNKHIATGFQYRLWTESDFAADIETKCSAQIALCRELCGVADIMRLEILYKYGGIFVDADSVCIEPIDDTLLENNTAFAAFENESMRPGLIANGTMGFVPGHPLLRDMIAEIASGVLDLAIPVMRAWQVLGPSLLTRFVESGLYPDMTVYPSHLFMPAHFEPTSKKYTGHRKVYAYQYWCTSNQSYANITDQEQLAKTKDPHYFQAPPQNQWVSVLVSSYNTPCNFLQECFASLKAQCGYFGIELVWINDGSTAESSRELEEEIALLEKTARFCKIVYVRTFDNRGVARAMNMGIPLCSHDIIMKMDADDIMLPDRIEKQLAYMDKNPDCMMCGAQIRMFVQQGNDGKKRSAGTTQHPVRISASRNDDRELLKQWFMNHPTICFRKHAMLELAAEYGHIYDPDPALRVVHDYDMLIRFVLKHGDIYNLPDILLMYRLHGDQLTHDHDPNSEVMKKIRRKYFG
jgi:hypothetical protein